MSRKSDLIDSLDAFTRSYIECMLWSTNDYADDSGGEPLDRNYSVDDLTIKTLRQIIADCKDFREMCSQSKDLPDGSDPLDSAGGDEQNGHDFWLTREGHGAGFWDRGYRKDVSDALCKAAKSFGGFDLSVWRGKIHG